MRISNCNIFSNNFLSKSYKYNFIDATITYNNNVDKRKSTCWPNSILRVTNGTEKIKFYKETLSPGVDINAKNHKLLRGLRCWVSGTADAINASIGVKKNVSNYNSTDDNIEYFIKKMTPSTNNVALISFSKSLHSAIIICHPDNTFSYNDISSNHNSNNNNSLIKLNILQIKNIIKQNIQKYSWCDLNADKVVFLSDMNNKAMEDHIKDAKPNYKFNLLTNNCSRFARDILLVGDESYEKGKRTAYRHDRHLQMPANTLELAKELAAERAKTNSEGTKK